MKYSNTIFKSLIDVTHTVIAVSVCIALSIALSYAEDASGREAASKALATIRQNMMLTREQIAELAKQVDGLKKDQLTLTTELVNAAKRERQLTDNIINNEQIIAKLYVQKSDVNENLKKRRAEFSEVLAALERMGLNPPPAILVRPDDALESVRSSVLLGALVPEMREKTMALSASLKELTRISTSITTQHEKLKSEVALQAEQQKKLSLLLSEKAKLQKTSEVKLMSQRKTNQELIEKAKSLEELLAELDRQSRIAFNNPNSNDDRLKLSQNLNFDHSRGHLVRPVSGNVIQKFGADDSSFNQGETIETVLGAIVTSPADAVVAFAGPFRSYGMVVILDVGQDYHILLAGMARNDVVQGQFVLAGEPIGAIGTQHIASATALNIGKSTPMLYVEFRKQGKPVNPAPWWSTGSSGRDQNDS